MEIGKISNFKNIYLIAKIFLQYEIHKMIKYLYRPMYSGAKFYFAHLMIEAYFDYFN